MFIPREVKTHQLEIKKSLFIATATPVLSADAAREIVRETRSRHPKCSHVVWAFILGDENSRTMGMSDDGEPKGTAGKPVLSTVQYSGLTNILVTVVRYFGGTKLGKGGLIKAYTESTKAVIDTIPKKKLVLETPIILSFGYEWYDPVKRVLSSHGAVTENESFGTGITVTGSVETEKLSVIEEELKEATNGMIQIKRST